MFNLKSKIQLLIAALIVPLLLSACSSSSSSAAAVALTVLGISGNNVSLDGTYVSSCFAIGGSVYLVETVVIAGSTVVATTDDYSDVGCATMTDTGTFTATVAVGAVGAITGWVDAFTGNSVTAPTAADASGLLSDTESYTALTLTITATTGSKAGSIPIPTTFNFFYIVDDSVVNYVLYMDYDFDGGATTASVTAPVIKQ